MIIRTVATIRDLKPLHTQGARVRIPDLHQPGQDFDAPEYPPPGAIAAAVQPKDSVWRRMARRAIERAGGEL